MREGVKILFTKIHVNFHTNLNILSTYFAMGTKFSLIRTTFLPTSVIFSSYPAHRAAMLPHPQMKLWQARTLERARDLHIAQPYKAKPLLIKGQQIWLHCMLTSSH